MSHASPPPNTRGRRHAPSATTLSTHSSCFRSTAVPSPPRSSRLRPTDRCASAPPASHRHCTRRRRPGRGFVHVGQSALVRGALPFAHDGCATTSACGACIDGFSSGTNVSFARAVEAGDVLQLAAIPAHFDGGRVAGEISFRFSPGGRFDFKSDVAVGPWDGVQLGDASTGCVVEKFEQLARGAPSRSTSRRAAAPFPTAPFAFRRVGGGGEDFTVTVDASDSTNVPWSSGGLLVTADADDGSTEWLALRSSAATRSSSKAVALFVAIGGGGGGRRRGGAVAAARAARRPVRGSWRRSDCDEYRPLRAAAAADVAPALLRSVRVGLTHTTSSASLGSVRLERFSLRVAVPPPPPTPPQTAPPPSPPPPAPPPHCSPPPCSSSSAPSSSPSSSSEAAAAARRATWSGSSCRAPRRARAAAAPRRRAAPRRPADAPCARHRHPAGVDAAAARLRRFGRRTPRRRWITAPARGGRTPTTTTTTGPRTASSSQRRPRQQPRRRRRDGRRWRRRWRRRCCCRNGCCAA